MRAGQARVVGAALVLGVACGPPEAQEVPWSATDPGPYAVGATVGVLADGDAQIPVTTWYPTDDVPTPQPLTALVDPDEAARFGALLDGLDATAAACVPDTVDVALDGVRIDGPLPTVVLSHCHTCLPVSYATIAARLASLGWVVVAPEHPGDTLWDRLDDDAVEVTNAALDDRVAWLDTVTTAALAEADGAPVVVAGHSFGAMTMGRVLADHADLAAGIGLFAPPDNPLYDTPDVATLGRPLMLALATEDQSITELGNGLIRDDLARAGTPVYGVELVDAGHWSINDTLAVIPAFDKGCGQGSREAGGAAFTWADPDASRAAMATEVATFLEATVRGREAAWTWLAQGDDAAVRRTLRR